MYLLYLDGSGTIADPNEKYFILAGVCVFDRQISWLNKQLDELAESLELGDASEIEFHGSPILQGKDEPWKALPREKRIEILGMALGILTNSHSSTRAFGVAAHKIALGATDPVEYAFEEVCRRFDLFLKREFRAGQPERGLIIMDESRYESSLQTLAMDFRKIGTRWGVLRNLPEVPLFVDSKASRLVQLADLVAFAMRRRYELADTRLFDPIVTRFDREGSILHGLVHHKPEEERGCACPACISRSRY